MIIPSDIILSITSFLYNGVYLMKLCTMNKVYYNYLKHIKKFKGNYIFYVNVSKIKRNYNVYYPIHMLNLYGFNDFDTKFIKYFKSFVKNSNATNIFVNTKYMTTDKISKLFDYFSGLKVDNLHVINDELILINDLEINTKYKFPMLKKFMFSIKKNFFTKITGLYYEPTLVIKNINANTLNICGIPYKLSFDKCSISKLILCENNYSNVLNILNDNLVNSILIHPKITIYEFIKLYHPRLFNNLLNKYFNLVELNYWNIYDYKVHKIFDVYEIDLYDQLNVVINVVLDK